MLSVCIPIFQEDVRPLVKDLVAQAQGLAVPWEICLLDDGSGEDWKMRNRELIRMEGVRYEELPRNVGRARIRNRLAQMAKEDYVLFLDGDSDMVKSDFLSTYWDHAHPGRVCCGGTVYSTSPPEDLRLWLHWQYGRTREARPVRERQEQPWEGFTSNNFLIPRSLLLQNPFEEKLREYGHEDTLFGLRLREMRIPVDQIDNPVGHRGLEIAEIFLEKQLQALRNLHRLKRSGFPVQTRLLEQADRLEAWGLSRPALGVLHPFLPALRKYLLSGKPALQALDLYKLGCYLHLVRKA